MTCHRSRISLLKAQPGIAEFLSGEDQPAGMWSNADGFQAIVSGPTYYLVL
jgi:hypothetical protein